MELRQLRYFLAVAESRSFVSASSLLYISRQAVSKAISQLESELGVELFVRDTSGAFLTPTGLLFYERVRGIVMDLDSLADQMKTSGNRYHQRIRIAFSVGTLSLVEERLLSFRESRENLEIAYAEYTEEECLRLLQEHQVDMIVTVCGGGTQLISDVLVKSPLGLLIRDSGEDMELEDVDVSDISWLPLAVHPDKQILDFCNRHRVKAKYEGQDYHRLYSLAAGGRCALLLPQCLFPKHIPGLRWVPLKQPEMWTLYSTYPQSAESNLLYSAVLEELNQEVLSLDKF